MPPSFTLYKLREHQDAKLSSLSPACIQAEAYFKLCGAEVSVSVQSCTSTSRSPTGQLPALACSSDVVGVAADPFQASRTILAYVAKHGTDLDANLTSAQRAEVLAFSGLIRSRLDVATDVSMWFEPWGFREHSKAAYSSTLPFPLNYIVPWTLRREVYSRHRKCDVDEVYDGACEALSAFADRLRTSTGHFFFGSKPSSLDALLVGHLAFYHGSPAAAPLLREKVNSDPALASYVTHILTTYFDTATAPAALSNSDERPAADGNAQEEDAGAAGTAGTWSAAAKGTRSRMPKMEPTPAELQQRRRAWQWLGGAGAAILCFSIYSGRYPLFQQLVEVLTSPYEEEVVEEDDE